MASASCDSLPSTGAVWPRLVNNRLASSESHSVINFALMVFGLIRAVRIIIGSVTIVRKIYNSTNIGLGL